MLSSFANEKLVGIFHIRSLHHKGALSERNGSGNGSNGNDKNRA